MYLRKGQQITKRQLPKFDYRGLTIIMSNPSRFDANSLLSATGGIAVEEWMAPDMLRANCDIRLHTEHQPLLKDTKAVLLFGERAMHEWCPATKTNTLNEQRGSLLTVQGLPAITTFNPQEAIDNTDLEGKFNPLARQAREGIMNDEDESGLEEKKRHGRTKPQNWKFWLQQDVKKAVRLATQGVVNLPTCEYILRPNGKQLIDILNSIRGERLFFDLETDPAAQILCLSFGTKLGDPVYGIPFLEPNYTWAYAMLPQIFAAFGKALYYNEAVAHNGAGFDFRVLAKKYGIGIGSKVYDTMLAQHRCHPKVEKSLGHCVSLWTDEEFHKDEADFSFGNHQAAERLLKYCCKDVYSMMLVREGIDNYAKTVPGLTESIEQVNACIKPYLTCMLQGIKVDNAAIERRVSLNDRKATQYMRIMQALTGPDIGPLISNQKCNVYFHKALGYKVQSRTSTGNPSLDRKSLLKLATKHPENPVFNVLIKYRETTKEASMLRFKQTPDGRTTTSYELSGTYTFRLASKKYTLSLQKDDKIGGNLQNWSKDTRECLVADPGKRLVQVDQSGAEALIVSYLCRQGTYRELFEAGIKCHTFVALHTFPQEWKKRFGSKIVAGALSCSPKDLATKDYWPDLNSYIKSSDDWPTSKRYYYIGKRISHSSNYGAKWPTFQLTVLEDTRGDLSLPAKDCKEFLATYHSLFPEIREWHEMTRYQVMKQGGILYNLFGYPCDFFDNKTLRTEKDWFAYSPQSTVGCITNIAFTRMYDYIAEHGKNWDLLQNCHDSYVIQCPEGEEHELIPKAIEFITPEFRSPIDRTRFKMKAEAQVGYNLGVRKEKNGIIVNPDGLVEYEIKNK